MWKPPIHRHRPNLRAAPEPRGDGRPRPADDQEKPMEAREAGSPARAAALPPLEWPLWKRVLTKFNNDDVMNQAAKVAYYFFMSLPSILMAVFSLASVVGDENTAEWLSTTLQGNLPPEGAALVRGFVTEVVRKHHPGPLSIGLILAVWFGAAVFISLEDTLNTAYAVTCARGFVKRVGVALGCMVAVGGLLTAGALALLTGPEIAKALGLGLVWTVLQWVLGFALVVAALWVIYFVLPSKDQRRCKLALLKASVFSALLFSLASAGFRLYAANFGSYSKTYGVLGGIIVLLLWMYYTSMAILLGGELASELERGG
jgi:membrane protein